MTRSACVRYSRIAVGIGINCCDVRRHDLREITQAVEVDVHDRDVGAKSGGHQGRVGTDNTAAENEHIARLNTRDATEQDAPAFLRAFQEFGALLHGEFAGDLAHGCEQGECGATTGRRRFERFVRDATGAGFEAAHGELFVRGEMEVGEDLLPPAHHRDLLRLRLLDLHDHVRVGPDIRGAVDHLGAGLDVLVIGEPGADPAVGLDEHLMPVPDQHLDADWAHPDAVFIRFHFFGDANDHVRISDQRAVQITGNRTMPADNFEPHSVVPEAVAGRRIDPCW